jgi:DNA modification methylase
VLAAQKLGIVNIPTMVASGWTEAQRRAFVIADNQLTLNGGWDAELLRLEVADLTEMGFDIPLLGFSADELSTLSISSGLTDPDEVLELPLIPLSAPGDTWLLGDHRLACGSSTDRETVARALDGESPHLMVTDQPYGVKYEPNWRNEAARHSATGMGNRAIGAGAIGKVTNDDRSDWREAWALFPGDVVYAWHAGKYASTVQASLEASGFDIRCQLIWAKSHFAIGRGDYHWQHEPCWYAVRKGKTGHWASDRKQTTVWEIPKPVSSETGHSTQKPVACMRRPIENNSKPGDGVYDPFVGSGTTIIAAEMTGRRCYAIEIDASYVDVAVKRWQDFTGRIATLDGTGESFADVSGRRSPQKVQAAE